MKKRLLERLHKELDLFENQKESDEYQNILNVIKGVENADVSILEEKADKFQGADTWLSTWTNGKVRRIYLNVVYKNGYKPNFNDRYVEF